jgi:AbrB family looped-hinge helix DNA binding protein
LTETVLSVKGQIFIPKDIRGKLGLKVGQRFEVEAMSDGTILIVSISEDIVGAMELLNGERLNRVLREERDRDRKQNKEF